MFLEPNTPGANAFFVGSGTHYGVLNGDVDYYKGGAKIASRCDEFEDVCEFGVDPKRLQNGDARGCEKCFLGGEMRKLSISRWEGAC